MTAPDQSRLPRMLLLSNEPPHTGAAGAIVFHRLLQDYPADRLLVVSNRLPPPESARLACRYAHVPLLADRLNRTRFWPWKAALRSLGAPELVGLGRIGAALQGFRPEVVVTLMQNSWYYDVAARFARDRALPLLLFVHDLPHGFEPVPAWLAGRQRARDRAIYRQAVARLCVSPGMAAWFEENYDAPAEVLLPPRDDAITPRPAEAGRGLRLPGRLTLGYAGGLHYGYGEQLLALLPGLRETGTRLEFFGPQPAGVTAALGAATDVIHFNGYAATPVAAWSVLRDRCDALILPYLDPAGPHESQYRTHFPSKLGDCLSLGLPLLVTGPDYASGVRWCAEHADCALRVTEPGPAALRDALVRLRDEPALRANLAAAALAAAPAFDAAGLRARLHAILQSLPAVHER